MTPYGGRRGAGQNIGFDWNATQMRAKKATSDSRERPAKFKEKLKGGTMKTVNIDGVEYVKKSEIALIPIHDSDKGNPFMVIGKDYFIRTVTSYFTGRLVWVGDKEIAIEDASWIADTGRFSEFVAGKTVNEVEPFPEGIVIVGRGAIVDMCERIGGLLLKVK